MPSRRINFSALFIFLIAIVFTSNGAPPINQDAKKLAKVIPKYKPQETKKAAENQIRQLIHLLAETNRDSASSNSALLKKAMDFRPDIGPHQKTTTIGAILKAWDAASDYGAISNHHFIGVPTKGRYNGERLVFENIVPQEMLPECTGYIGNLRIVPASHARKQGAPLDHKDEAYANGLRQVMYESKTRAAMLEIEKSKVGHLALTKGEQRERWLKEVAATGDSCKQRPNLRLLGQRMSTPSKLNGNVYRLRVEVTNMSRHPTEVEIESTIVGYTDNGNKIYEMKKDRRVLQLRRSQVEEYIISTPNVNVFKEPLKGFDPRKSQKVIYRGFTIIAKFKDGEIGSTGSDGRMMRVATGQYATPRMITKASRSAVIGKSSLATLEEGVVFESSPTDSGFDILIPPSRPSDKTVTANHKPNDPHPLENLTDGILAQDYGPVFANGITDGAYKMDLGRVVPVKAISSWAYQLGPRNEQVILLFGSDASSDPGWNIDDSSLFTSLGTISTRGQKLDTFTALSVRSTKPEDSLGEFRWIVWKVLPVAPKNGNTAFQELAVEVMELP